MARSIQLEDGYTRIANEILERAARHRLNGTQFRILLVVWRHTYGWGRKEAELSLSFLAEAIGASRSQVDRELTALIERNILEVVSGGNSRPRVLKFNKDFESWLDPPRRERKQREPPKPAPKQKKKRERRTYEEDSTYYRMAAYFHGKIREMAEQIDFNHASIKKADLQKWADDFRLLVERDGINDKRLIFDVINWVVKHDFWRRNVLSAATLRKHFPRLVLEMKSGGKKIGKTNGSDKRGSGQSMIDRLAAAQEWIDAGGDPYEFEPD